MSGWIQRIDRSSVTLSSRAEMNRRLCATQFNMPDPDVVWVVAVVGEVRQPRGVIDMGLFECGLIAFDAFTGDAVMMTAGALATCAPYFKDSLVPPDAAVVGPSQPYDNGVGRWFRFSPTRPGAVPLTIVRDDGWRQPSTVSGAVLMRAPVGSVAYQDAFCVRAVVRESPAKDQLRAGAVGASASSFPPLDYAIWLRDFHAVRADADAEGQIRVTIEPRRGFEWAFFDWSKISTGPSYVMFTFVDSDGSELAPWRLFNGP